MSFSVKQYVALYK